LNSRFVRARIDIAKVNILEAFALSDIIIVWNVNSNRSARASKSHNLIFTIRLTTINQIILLVIVILTSRSVKSGLEKTGFSKF